MSLWYINSLSTVYSKGGPRQKGKMTNGNMDERMRCPDTLQKDMGPSIKIRGFKSIIIQ